MSAYSDHDAHHDRDAHDGRDVHDDRAAYDDPGAHDDRAAYDDPYAYDDRDRPISGRQVALIDLLDRLLSGGVVLTGDLVLSIADIDLVRVSLRAVIVAVREQLDEQWALPLSERTPVDGVEEGDGGDDHGEPPA